MVSPVLFRSALSRFATGVTVITTLQRGKPAGITISSFASLSLSPALILFSLGSQARLQDAFTRGTRFAVHILSERQKDMAEHFAHRGHSLPPAAQFTTDDHGLIILKDCMTVLTCHVTATHPGGDHTVIVGGVDHIAVNEKRKKPLLYSQRHYHGLGRAKG